MSNYKERVDSNLRNMGTPAKEWSALDIIGFQEVANDKGETVKMPVFDFSAIKGYKKPNTLYPAPASQSTTAWTNCELCGKNIKNVYWIKNDSKKYSLAVGSECVTHFDQGKSGKEIERNHKIQLAIMLDNDVYNLRQLLLKHKSKVQYNKRQYDVIDIDYYANKVSDKNADYEKRINKNLKTVQYDALLRPDKARNAHMIYVHYLVDALSPFYYEKELKKLSIGNSYSESKESIDKNLLSWFTRNEGKLEKVIKQTIDVLNAFEYTFHKEYISDYLEAKNKEIAPKQNEESTLSTDNNSLIFCKKTDLKGNTKEDWMYEVGEEYCDEKTSTIIDEFKFKLPKHTGKDTNFTDAIEYIRNNSKKGKADTTIQLLRAWYNRVQPYQDFNMLGASLLETDADVVNVAKVLNKYTQRVEIRNAIIEGKYEQAINDGKMSIKDVQRIIQSAGLDVPDIFKTKNKGSKPIEKEENEPFPSEENELSLYQYIEQNAKQIANMSLHQIEQLLQEKYPEYYQKNIVEIQESETLKKSELNSIKNAARTVLHEQKDISEVNKRLLKLRSAILLDADLLKLSKFISDNFRNSNALLRNNYDALPLSNLPKHSIKKIEPLIAPGKNEIDYLYIKNLIIPFNYHNMLNDAVIYGMPKSKVEKQLLDWRTKRGIQQEKILYAAVYLLSKLKTKYKFESVYMEQHNAHKAIEQKLYIAATLLDVQFAQGGNINPYAICTTSIGKKVGTLHRSQWKAKDLAKYEHCILSVKGKN